MCEVFSSKQLEGALMFRPLRHGIFLFVPQET